MGFAWKNVSIEEQIRSKIAMSGECRTWKGFCHYSGSRTRYARPMLKHRQKNYSVVRTVWELAHGPIPKDKEICHTCDNPLCLRTSHLFIGTHKQNIADMDRKGRRVTARAEHHGSAKLAWEDVSIIRSFQDSRTHSSLAKEYGVTRSAITAIMNNRTWKTMPSEE